MPKGHPIQDDERLGMSERLAQRYRADPTLTVRTLAADVGLSYGAVHSMLASQGVLRPRGRLPGRRWPTTSPRSTPGVNEAPPKPDPAAVDVDAELREMFGGSDE